MEQFWEWLERLVAVFFVPATLYGGGGALLRCRKDRRTLGQILTEVSGGAFTAHMVAPIIQKGVSEDWHAICVFLAGWGGLELVGRLYEAIARGVEDRIRHRIAGGRDAE